MAPAMKLFLQLKPCAGQSERKSVEKNEFVCVAGMPAKRTLFVPEKELSQKRTARSEERNLVPSA